MSLSRTIPRRSSGCLARTFDCGPASILGGFVLEDERDAGKLAEAAKAYWAVKQPTRKVQLPTQEKEAPVCPICDRMVEDDEGQKDDTANLDNIVVCDGCDSFFHLERLEQKGVDLSGCSDQDLEWLCMECVKKKEQVSQ
jgi:hypothetical protein